MGTYIHFTDEQKERANSVDLEEFLRQRGEKLLRAGRESRLARVHHITVRGNEWYDHIARQGGLLYVFEAPMDLLSFLTLYPDRWQEHSYVALCGTGGQAVCWMLEQHPSLQSVVLCLAQDEPGQDVYKRQPVDKVSFADELSECGGLLQFYMPVAFAPDAVFGTHVATAENDGWLNVYAA